MQIAPLLNIIMPTYNHEKYIGQAIESVLMQQCDFPFRLLIGDDFSTDTTQNICLKYAVNYPDIITLLSTNCNLGIIDNYKRLFDCCTAPYIAILEGDDYWTDPSKLEKQILAFTLDENVGFVHTGFEVIYQDGGKKIGHKGTDLSKLSGNVLGESQIIDFTISPLTVCFKRMLLQYLDFDFILNSNLQTIDAVLWTEFAHHTQFAYIQDITGCYRILNNSISNTRNIEAIKKFNDTSKCILTYFITKYNIPPKLANSLMNRQYLFMIGKYIERKMWYEAEFEAKLAVSDSFSSKLKIFIAHNHSYWFVYMLYIYALKKASNFKQLLFN